MGIRGLNESSSTTAAVAGLNAVLGSNPQGSSATVKARLDMIEAAEFPVARYGAVGNGTTDDTAAFTSAIQAAYSNGGGVVVLDAKDYKVTGPLVLPTTDVSRTTPVQQTIAIVGKGSGWNGVYLPRGELTPATRVLLHGSSANGLIQTNGTGLLSLRGIQFEYAQNGTDTSPFIKTTNTTLDIERCAFVGHTSITGTTTKQDAIVLGGTQRIYNSESDAAFGGYGTTIRDNYFSRIRAGVVVNVWAESNIIEHNMWDLDCGGTAAVEITTASTDRGLPDVAHTNGNVLIGNRFCVKNYTYGVRVVGSARRNIGLGNAFWDNLLGTCVAAYRCEMGAEATGGQVYVFGGYNEANAWLSDPVGTSVVYASNGEVYGKTYIKGDEQHDAPVILNNMPSSIPLTIKFQSVDSSVHAQIGQSGLGKGYWHWAGGGAGTTRIVQRGYDNSGNAHIVLDPNTGIQLGGTKTLKLASGATGSRPTASSAGVGSVWFDTTLNKPIFSDGTNWRDAAGTIV